MTVHRGGLFVSRNDSVSGVFFPLKAIVYGMILPCLLLENINK